MQVGDRASLERVVTADDIKAFAEVSLDKNPIHLDPEYAAGTRFGRPIAHGMIAASLISAVLGNQLPGPGSIYLGQTLRFVKPVFPGDRITAGVEVTALDRRRVTLRTDVHNQDGDLVLDGEAQLLVSVR